MKGTIGEDMYYFWSGLLGVIALLWVIGSVRMLRGMAKVPRLAAVAPLSDTDCPTVSILVAARDEAAKLPQALPTLLAQDYPRCEVIVVDDRSQDDTPEILDEFARQHPNLKVIHLTELPKGWLGKPHAIAEGYQQASGEWLVFTDADVHFAPDVLRRVIGVAKEQDWEHLNVLPHLELVGFWEKTVLSVWALSSILWLEPWRVSNPRSRRYFGFGALQAVRRNAYEAIGTHRRLAMEVVDDIKLGKLAMQAGLRSGVAIAGDRVRLRYVEGLHNIVRSISKSAFAACDYRVGLITGGVLANLVLYISPFVAVLFAPGIPRALAAAAVLSILVLHGRGLIAVRVSSLYAATYPLGAAVFYYILLHSMIVTLWRGGVLWRDTFYPLEELRKGVV
jgi:glycosyltransferase involved in cell wall biosynthesis